MTHEAMLALVKGRGRRDSMERQAVEVPIHSGERCFPVLPGVP